MSQPYGNNEPHLLVQAGNTDFVCRLQQFKARGSHTDYHSDGWCTWGESFSELLVSILILSNHLRSFHSAVRRGHGVTFRIVTYYFSCFMVDAQQHIKSSLEREQITDRHKCLSQNLNKNPVLRFPHCSASLGRAVRLLCVTVQVFSTTAS